MQPHHLLARHGEQAERIGVAHVRLGRERKSPDVVEGFQLVGRDLRGVELGADMRDLGIGVLQLCLEPRNL